MHYLFSQNKHVRLQKFHTVFFTIACQQFIFYTIRFGATRRFKIFTLTAAVSKLCSLNNCHRWEYKPQLLWPPTLLKFWRVRRVSCKPGSFLFWQPHCSKLFNPIWEYLDSWVHFHSHKYWIDGDKTVSYSTNKRRFRRDRLNLEPLRQMQKFSAIPRGVSIVIKKPSYFNIGCFQLRL